MRGALKYNLLQGGGYATEAAALFARFSTPPTPARKTLINNLIVSLKGEGIWYKFDALYIMAAADTQAAGRNWIADRYNLTEVAAPTFTTDRGYASNGSSSYLRTGFTPRSATSAKMVQNSGHVSVWVRTARAAQDGYIMGAFDGVVNTAIWTRGVGNLAYLRVNDVAASISNSNSDGHFIASRTGASVRVGYRNGASIGSGTEASGLLTNAEIYLTIRNNAGTPAFALTDEIAQASIGSGLTAAESLAYYNAVAAYLTAVGAA